MRKVALFKSLLLVVTFAMSVAGSARADEDTENRLRDALRTTTQQLRALQDEQATWQVRQTESDKQVETLKAQVAGLMNKPAGESQSEHKDGISQADYDKAVKTFNSQLAGQQAVLDKWKAAYAEAANIARAKESERAKLASQVDGVNQQVTSCEAKNEKLFAVGNEILKRYEDVGLGDALGASEPFVATKRVELETIAQDYEDKLLDNKAKP